MSIIKICVLSGVVYAVVTAAPAERLAMYDGVRAFASAIVGACTREHSPCRRLVTFVYQEVAVLSESARPVASSDRVDTTRRALDDSPRRMERSTN
jgi:hypothetical protein